MRFYQLCCDYRDIFASPGNVSEVNILQNSIHNESEGPVKSRAHWISLEKIEAKKQEVKKMLEKGVIELSKSSWSSPIVLVKKKVAKSHHEKRLLSAIQDR